MGDGELPVGVPGMGDHRGPGQDGGEHEHDPEHQAQVEPARRAHPARRRDDGAATSETPRTRRRRADDADRNSTADIVHESDITGERSCGQRGPGRAAGVTLVDRGPSSPIRSAAGPGAPRFLTLADVAEVLNISASQTYALVRSGELVAIKIGGRGQWRVERSELEAYIARMYDQTREFVASHPVQRGRRRRPRLTGTDRHGRHPVAASGSPRPAR